MPDSYKETWPVLSTLAHRFSELVLLVTGDYHRSPQARMWEWSGVHGGGVEPGPNSRGDWGRKRREKTE